MKRTRLVAVVLAAALAAPLAAQSPGGMRYVMTLELKALPGEAPPAPNSMPAMMAAQVKQMLFPEGPVEMEFVTDGQSVRTEMHTAMAMLPKGAVVVYPAGQSDGFVLNPGDKTYYVMKTPQPPTLPGGTALPKPEITVKPTGTFDTIAGHKAEKVAITWRMPVPVPEGAQVPPGMPAELTMDLEDWCASDMKVPPGAGRMMGAIAQSLPGLGMDELMKACGFPLRSTMKMSILPGYAMVSAVTSTGDASPGPEMFKVPAGYKEVPPPTGRTPGGE